MRSDAQSLAVSSRELRLPWVKPRNFHGQFWLDGALEEKRKGQKVEGDEKRRLGPGQGGVRSPRKEWKQPTLSYLPGILQRGCASLDNRREPRSHQGVFLAEGRVAWDPGGLGHMRW